jgi:tight adherence protein C
MQLGEPVDRALEHLERRCPSHTIPPFVAALRRAERHGTPLQPTLAAQATEARSQRAARRSEQAAKAAPKIQLVVALMLVPAVLLLIAAALVPSIGA